MSKYYVSIEMDSLVLSESTGYTGGAKPVGIPKEYESFEIINVTFVITGAMFGFFDKNIISTEVDLEIKSDKEVKLNGKIQGAFTVKSRFKDHYNDDFFSSNQKFVQLTVELEFADGKCLNVKAENWDGLESSGAKCTFHKTKKDLNNGVAMIQKQ